MFIRILGILFRPKQEWGKIGTEKNRLPEAYLVLGITSIAMGLLFVRNGLGEVYYQTIVWFASIHLCTVLSWLPHKLFENKATYTAIFKLMVYAMLPFVAGFAIGLAAGAVKVGMYAGAAAGLVVVFNAVRYATKPFSLFDALMYTFYIGIIALFSNYLTRVLMPML